MDFSIQEIQNYSFKLAGHDAHKDMAPYRKHPSTSQKTSTAKSAAVEILLFHKDNEWHFPLIERPTYKGHHSGQISLPGGKQEKSDKSLSHTAIRETYEEIGIAKNDICQISELTEIYIPPSDFLVSPFLGYIEKPAIFKKDTYEVQNIIEVPIKTLLDPSIVKNKKMRHGKNFIVDTPYFDIHGHVIWGATAMILAEFKHLLLQINKDL